MSRKRSRSFTLDDLHLDLDPAFVKAFLPQSERDLYDERLEEARPLMMEIENMLNDISKTLHNEEYRRFLNSKPRQIRAMSHQNPEYWLITYDINEWSQPFPNVRTFTRFHVYSDF